MYPSYYILTAIRHGAEHCGKRISILSDTELSLAVQEPSEVIWSLFGDNTTG